MTTNWKNGLLIVLMLVLVSACRQQEAASSKGILISLIVQPAEVNVGESTLGIGVTTESLDPVAVNNLTVRGDMNHAGMVPVIVENLQSANGQFQVPFAWSMGGDWIVEVTAELADGRTASQTFDISVGTANGGEMPMSGDMDMSATDEATAEMDMDMPTTEEAGS